jgi:hypothetical protein
MASSRYGAGVSSRAFPSGGQRLASQSDTAKRSRRDRLSGSAAAAVSGDICVRVNSAISAFAASLIAFAPFQAFAQETSQNVSVRDRPRPEYDPIGLRFGGFDLNARLDAGVTYTDNLFALPSGQAESDVYYQVSPSARLSSHWSRHALALSAGYTHTFFTDHSSESSDTGYVGADGRLDVGVNTHINAAARYARAVEPRTNPDALTGGRPVEYTVGQASLSAQHTFNRFRVGAGVDTATYDYQPVPGPFPDQNLRDHTENGVNGSIEAELSPRIGILFNARADHRDYDKNPALTSDGQAYLAGVALHLTDLIEGRVTVGQFNRDYDGPAGSVSGFAAASNVDWYVTQLTTVHFNVSRGAQEDGATANEPYIETSYGVGADHELLRNVILMARVQHGTRDYQVIDRNDTFTSAEVGADYMLNRRVGLSARYRYDDLTSGGALPRPDYTVNAVYLGLSLHL